MLNRSGGPTIQSHNRSLAEASCSAPLRLPRVGTYFTEPGPKGVWTLALWRARDRFAGASSPPNRLSIQAGLPPGCGAREAGYDQLEWTEAGGP